VFCALLLLVTISKNLVLEQCHMMTSVPNRDTCLENKAKSPRLVQMDDESAMRFSIDFD